MTTFMSGIRLLYTDWPETGLKKRRQRGCSEEERTGKPRSAWKERPQRRQREGEVREVDVSELEE